MPTSLFVVREIPLTMILSSNEAKAQTNGVAPCPEGYNDRDMAVNVYNEKLKNGECRVKAHK
jgi:hypothetical protein